MKREGTCQAEFGSQGREMKLGDDNKKRQLWRGPRARLDWVPGQFKVISHGLLVSQRRCSMNGT